MGKMKVTVIPPIIGALGTMSKGLVKEVEDLVIRGQEEIIQSKNFQIGQKTDN